MSVARIAEQQIVTPVIPESVVPARTYNVATSLSTNSSGGFAGLECLVELRADDAATGIQFRECLIDYTRCPNKQCIKKLM